MIALTCTQLPLLFPNCCTGLLPPLNDHKTHAADDRPVFKHPYIKLHFLQEAQIQTALWLVERWVSSIIFFLFFLWNTSVLGYNGQGQETKSSCMNGWQESCQCLNKIHWYLIPRELCCYHKNFQCWLFIWCIFQAGNMFIYTLPHSEYTTYLMQYWNLTVLRLYASFLAMHSNTMKAIC